MLDILPPWSELKGRSRDEYHMIVNNQRVASHPRLNTSRLTPSLLRTSTVLGYKVERPTFISRDTL